ncbi:MAG: cysteine desulfurase family protein [Prochlorococcaceae cyanobacterium]
MAEVDATSLARQAPARGLAGYFDACATSPPALEVLAAMAQAQESSWANPSSLHRQGLAAAETLERSRQRVAAAIGAQAEELVFCSGGSEAAAAALWGLAANLPPGRLLISAVEHAAVPAGCRALQRLGWQLQTIPVDRHGHLDLNALEALLDPPTRLVSVIWGQNEVGTLAPIARIGALCKARGIRIHSDAVQVAGHLPIDFANLPLDALSFSAHKLQGPRGIGALAVRRGLPLAPLIGGGSQEGGRRGGTEAVVLASGFAAALDLAQARLVAAGGIDPIAAERQTLQDAVLKLEGCQLTGCPQQRLPHHISLLVATRQGRPLPGRRIVAAMDRQGFAISSGSACSSGQDKGSAVLRAMGFDGAWSVAGIRLSLGPWLAPEDLAALPAALERACAEVDRATG